MGLEKLQGIIFDFEFNRNPFNSHDNNSDDDNDNDDIDDSNTDSKFNEVG